MSNITSENIWYRVKPQQPEAELPCPRSGHTAIFYKHTLLFIFGGLTNEDALNDMFVYDLMRNVKLLI